MLNQGVVLLALSGAFAHGAEGPLDKLRPGDIPEELRLPDQPPEVVAVFLKHNRAVAALAFSPDGRLLVSASWDNAIKVRRFGKGEENEPLKGSASGLAFSPSGKMLVSGGEDALVHVWDVSGPKSSEVRKLSGHKNRPFAVALSPDGKLLASGCGDPALRVWKLEGDEPEAWGVLANERAPSLGVSSLAFSHDSKYLAAGHHTGRNSLRIWDVAGNFMDELDFPGTAARLVAFSPKEPLLAFSGDESIRLWEVKDGKTRAKSHLAGHPRKGQAGVVKALAFAPEGKWLASAGEDHKVVVWELTSAARRKEWQFSEQARALAFAPDGRHLAVGNDEGIVFILRIAPMK